MTTNVYIIFINIITPVHVIQVAANNKLAQLGSNWFRKKWIKNEATCL